jgi:hypothetical protein
MNRAHSDVRPPWAKIHAERRHVSGRRAQLIAAVRSEVRRNLHIGIARSGGPTSDHYVVPTMVVPQLTSTSALPVIDERHT